MLIVNDEQRLRAGIGSLSKRCQYCSKALAAYPLILSDDARLAVYHAACAAELATEILVDLYTFLSPPAPAINEYSPDQGGSEGASLQRWDTGEVSNGAGGGDQEEERAAPGDDLWLVPRGECEH